MPHQIILTGPESTGKTTLCKSLSEHYNCAWVPEYARQYLSERQGMYGYADLLKMSQGQLEVKQGFKTYAKEFLIMDTGLEVYYIWSIHKFGKVDPDIEKGLQAQRDNLHLLCRPDIKWVPDPLRESEYERDILFCKYEELLKKYDLPYGIVEGEGPQRIQAAIELIDAFTG